MNFHFNEEDQEILDMLHEFALKEVAPIAAEIDEEERFPEETWHKLADMGMMGVPFAEEYSGAAIFSTSQLTAGDFGGLVTGEATAHSRPLTLNQPPTCTKTEAAHRHKKRGTACTVPPLSAWVNSHFPDGPSTALPAPW